VGWFSDLPEDEQQRLIRLLDEPGGADASKAGGDDIEYACWLLAVDRLCQERHEASIFDLRDMTWPAWYEDGLVPSEALVLALEEEGLTL